MSYEVGNSSKKFQFGPCDAIIMLVSRNIPGSIPCNLIKIFLSSRTGNDEEKRPVGPKQWSI